jgi:hypothetical protein
LHQKENPERETGREIDHRDRLGGPLTSDGRAKAANEFFKPGGDLAQGTMFDGVDEFDKDVPTALNHLCEPIQRSF